MFVAVPILVVIRFAALAPWYSRGLIGHNQGNSVAVKTLVCLDRLTKLKRD